MTAKPLFGIVQGRLIQSPPGCLQWFPQEHWRSEFFLAHAVGLDYVELIAETEHNSMNPLWSDAGLVEIQALTERNGLCLHALCNDFVVAHRLPGSDAVLEQTIALIERGRRLEAAVLVLPLFDASELRPDGEADAFLNPLRRIADVAAGADMTVCLETILTGTELIDFLDRLDHPGVSVVYDLGNRVAFGHDLAGDIRLLGNRIRHVHVKDKNAANQNVVLGTGLVNFTEVFGALEEIGYGGPFTFETFRGADPVRTARYNIDLVRYFRAEAADRARAPR